MRLWDVNCNASQIHSPEWLEAWDLLTRMHQLKEIRIDLDAYISNISLRPETELEVFKPLMNLTRGLIFVVTTSWPEDSRASLLRQAPFRLIHSTIDEMN